MPIPNRSRNEDGQLREKRGDTLIKNLKEYSEFTHINGNTKLGTLKDKFEVDSLDAVRRELRK